MANTKLIPVSERSAYSDLNRFEEKILARALEKKASIIRIDLGYKIPDTFGVFHTVDRGLERVAEKYDGYETGCGSGFGIRDWSGYFVVKNERQIESIKSQLNRVILKNKTRLTRITVDVNEWDDNLIPVPPSVFIRRDMKKNTHHLVFEGRTTTIEIKLNRKTGFALRELNVPCKMVPLKKVRKTRAS